MAGRVDIARAPFRLPTGSRFARTFETARGQILATIEPNDQDNAALVLRAWTPEGLGEVWLGVGGNRAAGADAIIVEQLEKLEADKVLAAWELALDNHQRVGLG